MTISLVSRSAFQTFREIDADFGSCEQVVILYELTGAIDIVLQLMMAGKAVFLLCLESLANDSRFPSDGCQIYR